MTDEEKPAVKPALVLPKPSMQELTKQHRFRWRYTLACGQEIVLKQLGKIAHQQVFMDICRQDPEYEKAAKLVGQYQEVDQYPGGKDSLPPDKKAERDWAYAMTGKYNPWYYVPCFVKPQVNNFEQLEDAMGLATEDEWILIQKMLLVLTAPLPAMDRNILMLGIGSEYGIRWAPDLFLENITLQQYQVLIENEKAKAEATAAAIKALKDKDENG